MAKERLRAFLEKNPDNAYLKSFKFDSSIPEEERGKEIRATIMAQVLPQIMKADKVRMAARSTPYPLAFKSSHVGEGSLFAYFSRSIASDDVSDYLVIFNNLNNIEEENDAAINSNSVVIDISALLTLTHLNILVILEEFDLVILSRGTRNVIELELAGITPSHELANKLEKWRLANKHKIRVRAIITDYDDELVSDSHQLSAAGIYLRRNTGIANVIGAGMGESVLLAQQLKLPLYSDDSTMRHLASTEYQVKAFSSLSLLQRCLVKRSITKEAASGLFARLIESHYLFVPFSADHMTHALYALLKSNEGKKLSSDDLLNDKVLGVYLREFGNTNNALHALLNIACEWWLQLMAEVDPKGWTGLGLN